MSKQDDEIAAWYRQKAAEQRKVMAEISEHRKVCMGGSCEACRKLEHQFDMSSMGD